MKKICKFCDKPKRGQANATRNKQGFCECYGATKNILDTYRRDKDVKSNRRKQKKSIKSISCSNTNFSNEKELFDYLWNSRGNRSEISGKSLLPTTHEFWHWQFSHVLPKGLYKRFKFYPRNIVLMLPEEHRYVTEHEGEARKKKDWEWYFLLKDYLKIEYNLKQ